MAVHPSWAIAWPQLTIASIPPLVLFLQRCVLPIPRLDCSFYPGCVYGATTYVECFTFAIITQMTIGERPRARSPSSLAPSAQCSGPRSHMRHASGLVCLHAPGLVPASWQPASCFAPTSGPAGYGNTGPQNCWAAAWLIAVQIITALLLESIVIGIVFA